MDEAEMNTTELDEPKISLNDISFKKFWLYPKWPETLEGGEA